MIKDAGDAAFNYAIQLLIINKVMVKNRSDRADSLLRGDDGAG